MIEPHKTKKCLVSKTYAGTNSTLDNSHFKIKMSTPISEFHISDNNQSTSHGKCEKIVTCKIVKSSLFIVLYNINSSCKNPSVLPSNWHKFQANCDKNRPTAFIVDMENKRSHCR